MPCALASAHSLAFCRKPASGPGACGLAAEQKKRETRALAGQNSSAPGACGLAAALLLFLCCFFGSGLAPGAAFAAQGSFGQSDSLPVQDPEHMQSVSEKPSRERSLEGSLIGALVFGHPFESLGQADFLLMTIIAYGFMRAAMFKQWRDAARRRGQKNRPGDKNGKDWIDEEWEDFQKQLQRAGQEEEAKRAARERGEEPADDAPLRDEDSADDASARNGGSADDDASVRNDGSGDNTSAGNEAREAQDRMREKGLSEDMLPRDVVELSGQAAAANDATDRAAKDFIRGARMLYLRLQESWAARDVDDLAPFVTPPMLRALREQAALDPRPEQLRILTLAAGLEDFDFTAQSHASVRFEAVMHLGPEGAANERIRTREIWRFVRDVATDGMWRLDGIEQAQDE